MKASKPRSRRHGRAGPARTPATASRRAARTVRAPAAVKPARRSPTKAIEAKPRSRPRQRSRRNADILAFKADDSVGYLLRMTSRAFTRAFQERIAQDGMTIGMWYYLRALWEEDGLTQSELSQKVETMDPSTGSALRKMERLGLIYRSADTQDRRKWHIFLTEKAKKNRAKYLRHSIALQDYVETILTAKEENMLRMILKKLRESLRRTA